MALNGISTLTYKRQRQDAKLEIAEAKRQGKTVTASGGSYSISGAVDSSKSYYRAANTLDASRLPTRYGVGSNDPADIVNNANIGGLKPGRPWV